jgi:hypothetical protein
MPHIRISASTKMALRCRAFGRFLDTSERLPGGGWLIQIDDEVHYHLANAKIEGETIDDTIQRLIRLTDGTPLN